MNTLELLATYRARYTAWKAESVRVAEDNRPRRTYILNIVLISTITLLFVASLYVLHLSTTLGFDEPGTSFDHIVLVLLYFIFLYVLHKRGHLYTASTLLVASYYLITTYSATKWGVSLPANLLSYSLVITISSILIGNLFGLLITTIIFATIVKMGIHESAIQMIYHWKSEPVTILDTIFYAFMLSAIMTVSWLSNRETEASLKRARASEKALQHERDLLELKVVERTAQLSHFAEFGKLSSGLFHDLVNPLFSISLNLSQVENSLHPELQEIKDHLKRSLGASSKMERYLSAIKSQIKVNELKEHFCLNTVIEDSILLLNYKAKAAGVDITLATIEPFCIFHNPLQFQHIVTNLISNAIDAHTTSSLTTSTQSTQKWVRVGLTHTDTHITLTVEDNGPGIPDDVLPQIFSPFFTTKQQGGIGIGLATTKHVVESGFQGTLSVSTSTSGTIFTMSFPYPHASSTTS